jgi:hypothetical protein
MWAARSFFAAKRHEDIGLMLVYLHPPILFPDEHDKSATAGPALVLTGLSQPRHRDQNFAAFVPWRLYAYVTFVVRGAVGMSGFSPWA